MKNDVRRCPECRYKYMVRRAGCYPEWYCPHCEHMASDEDFEKEDDDV